MTTYLTAAQFDAYRLPDALQEAFEIKDLGGAVLIQGITAKAQREAVYAEIKDLKASRDKSGLDGVVGYTPDDDDIAAAVWAAACVAEPKLTPIQWLTWASQGYMILGEIYVRCLVCSRVIGDPKDKVPDGIEGAKGEQQDDPLGSSGGSSA